MEIEKGNQVKTSGNRCGHDKMNPISFIAPTMHKRRPPLIEKAKRMLSGLYADPLSLDAGRLSFNPEKENRRGGYRKIRSEKRELTLNFAGQAMLHYLDLNTLQLGWKTDKGNFIDIGFDTLNKKINESLSFNQPHRKVSYESLRRAINIFESCGYIQIERVRIRLPNGEYRSLPSRIKVNEIFFEHLGIDKEFINKSIRSEERRNNSIILNQKAKEYNKDARISKKVGKQAIRKMKDLLNAARAGKPLNQDERALLDVEYPGLLRRRDPETLYPDFISKLIKPPPN